MAVIETWLNQDLQKPVKVQYIDGSLFSNNGNGNRIGVVVTDNGEPVTISGTVSGYVVVSDGSTVPCTGAKSGNRASILIPPAAYVPGSAFISLFVTDGTTVTTLAALSTTVLQTRTGTQVDPGSVVTDWTQTINGAMQDVQTAAANLGSIVATPYASLTYPVPLGKYTYYDGGLYRCISPIASSETFTPAHWTAVKLGDDVSDLKSALDSLDEFCRKELTVTFTNNKTVPTNGVQRGNFIITCDVPSGTTYSIIINDPNNALGDGGLTLYAHYSDSTHESLGTKQKNTEYSFDAPKNVVAFSIYKGTTNGGTINTVVSYSTNTEDSLEERIDDLETIAQTIGNKVDKANMGHCELISDPASSNVMDMTKLVLDKKANPVYGQIQDDTNSCYYQMAVTPGDTLYLWAYGENESDPLYPYAAVIKNITCTGIAAYDSTGSVKRDAGTTSYVHSYTVPTGISTIIINLLKSQYTSGYKFIITINDSTMPKRYYPYKEAEDNYYSRNKFVDKVDFNRILPISTRMPTNGFIETFGHMGLSTYYPGNTKWSTIGAKKAGMDGVEMDTQITADGVYVLYHDDNMVRVGGTAQQNIGNMTYSQLQQFDYGAWFGNEFAGTPLCTFEEAVKICKLLNLKIDIDCKTLLSVSDFSGAYSIIKKWGMENNTYWSTGSFLACWEAIPDAKIMFPAGSPLTGSEWQTSDGWFESAISGDSIPASKKHLQDGHYVMNDDVFLGISQNYTLGLQQVKTESELARKYNMQYGLYAVDDIEDIAEYAEEMPYIQYMASNSIAFQTAMNEHYGVNVADYLLI